MRALAWASARFSTSLTDSIIGAAIAVHRELGPGLLESAYETGLAIEFAALGLDFVRQRTLPFVYRGVTVDKGYRIDFMVEQKVVVEVKAIERIERVHRAQVLSYLKQTGCKVGLLFNFNVRILMPDGFRRIANGFPE
jgi:GxxExxY protein